MSTYIFDLETDGLLEDLTKIHCLVIKDHDTNKIYSYSPKEVEEGIKRLSSASSLIGHNILKFDLPAIKKIFPNWETKAKIIDTIICSRLIWADIKQNDFKHCKRAGFPTKMIGKHSLASWGHRLGILKDDFAENTDWKEWSKEMQKYCEQDVELNHVFYKKILSKNYSQKAMELEHEFQKCILQQEQQGFCFDKKKGEQLYNILSQRRAYLEQELQQCFPEWHEDMGEFIPARDNKTLGYVKGVAVHKVKKFTFNPASRDHIANRLQALKGWKPKEFSNNGKPVVDEKVLSELDYPEAELLSEYLMINKRIGMLAEGQQAWLKLERNGKIYGSVVTNGTNTGRCVHMRPNIAQCVGLDSKYGRECRSLFNVPPGYRLVGIDFSSLELSVLASYIAPLDNGEFIREVTEGDLHALNQKRAGLPSRSLAKRFIFALNYGAGDRRIGEIINGSSKDGREIKERFYKNTPALRILQDKVRIKASQIGYLKGLDGRHLDYRSLHSCFNLLIQSGGSILVKQATVNLHKELKKRGFIYGEEWAMVAHVHDELQLQVKEELADTVGKIAIQVIKDTQKDFNFRCPLNGEYKVGGNWAETH